MVYNTSKECVSRQWIGDCLKVELRGCFSDGGKILYQDVIVFGIEEKLPCPRKDVYKTLADSQFTANRPRRTLG